MPSGTVSAGLGLSAATVPFAAFCLPPPPPRLLLLEPAVLRAPAVVERVDDGLGEHLVRLRLPDRLRRLLDRRRDRRGRTGDL